MIKNQEDGEDTSWTMQNTRGLADSLECHQFFAFTLPRPLPPPRAFKRWCFWLLKFQTSDLCGGYFCRRFTYVKASKEKKGLQPSASSIRYAILCNFPNNCMRWLLLLSPNKWGNQEHRGLHNCQNSNPYLPDSKVLTSPTTSNSAPKVGLWWMSPLFKTVRTL